MSGHREHILLFLASFPGRDDDGIASALKISPRQTVNGIFRTLCEEGLLRRERGPRGKLINFILGDASSGTGADAASQMRPTIATVSEGESNGPFTEDQIKAAIAKMLDAAGWSVQIAWGRIRGVDITPTRGKERGRCPRPAPER